MEEEKDVSARFIEPNCFMSVGTDGGRSLCLRSSLLSSLRASRCRELPVSIRLIDIWSVIALRGMMARNNEFAVVPRQ